MHLYFETCNSNTTHLSPLPLLLGKHPAHVTTDPRVVEQTLNLAYCRNGNILVPDALLGKLHNIVGGDSIDGALDLARAHAPAGRDDLAADILGQGGGAVQGQQNGCLELGLGTLGLGFGHGLGETRPLAQSKVDEVVDAVDLVSDEVYTPETVMNVR